MSRLHIFDMDGTLLHGSTASLEIARALDCVPQVKALEAQFAEGEITTAQFAAGVCALWQSLSTEQAAQIFAASPWMQQLPQVFADIRQRGEHSIVITLSPDFYANYLLAQGADRVVGSIFPPLPFRQPPQPENILTPQDKVTHATALIEQLQLSAKQCVAYGDSGSDIPLFQMMQNTVAINGSSSIVSLAKVSYQGDNLWDAYQLARSSFW